MNHNNIINYNFNLYRIFDIINSFFKSISFPSKFNICNFPNLTFSNTFISVISLWCKCNSFNSLKLTCSNILISDISSLLKFNISSTTVDLDDIKNPITYTILDVFKYNNNDDLGDSFDEIRNKIKLLDRDEEYNYMFIPTDNDLIKNPLTPKSFFNSNHVFNKFTIPQMNFDALDYKYITTKV